MLWQSSVWTSSFQQSTNHDKADWKCIWAKQRSFKLTLPCHFINKRIFLAVVKFAMLYLSLCEFFALHVFTGCMCILLTCQVICMHMHRVIYNQIQQLQSSSFSTLLGCGNDHCFHHKPVIVDVLDPLSLHRSWDFCILQSLLSLAIFLPAPCHARRPQLGSDT